MKIVTLNIWGGRVLEPLSQFAQTKLQKADIICLQEVLSAKESLPGVEVCTNTLERLLPLMNEYRFVYNSNVVDTLTSNISLPGLRYGNAIFVRKTIQLRASHNYYIVKQPGDNFDLERGEDHPRALQVVQLSDGAGHDFAVANYHGYWSNGPKMDDDVRIKQTGLLVFLPTH